MTDYNTEWANQVYREAMKEDSVLREKFRIVVPASKEDAEILRYTNEGDLISRNPPNPNNPKEAFALFRDYYAQLMCIHFYREFILKYRVVNEVSIKAELEELDKWKEEAQKENYAEACREKTDPYFVHDHSKAQKYEYLRLINGFYEGYCMKWDELKDTSRAAQIYGEYVLLYERLQKELLQLQSCNNVEHEEPENDIIVSTIDDYLETFKTKGAITYNDYEIVKAVLTNYFKGKTVKEYNPVFVKYGNKKKLAFACGELYKALKAEPITYEYLFLIKSLFQIFISETIEETNYNKSNLYNYCTTRTQ